MKSLLSYFVIPPLFYRFSNFFFFFLTKEIVGWFVIFKYDVGDKDVTIEIFESFTWFE